MDRKIDTLDPLPTGTRPARISKRTRYVLLMAPCRDGCIYLVQTYVLMTVHTSDNLQPNLSEYGNQGSSQAAYELQDVADDARLRHH